MHHYVESGLPYIYLTDGFRIETGPYGETLAVQDVDDLHRAIGRWIVDRVPHLRGREVRFLRLEMDRTQAELAAELGVTEQTVSLWERSPDKPVPASADRLLRLIFDAALDEGQTLAGAMARIREASGRAPVERQPFQRREHWGAAA